MAAGRTITLMAAAIVSAVSLSSCSGGGLMADGAGGRAGESAPAPRAEAPANQFSLGAAPSQSSAAPLPSVRQAIIKTARLEVEVARDGLQDAVDEATQVADQFGGFVVTTSLDEDRFRSGTLVLRVPAHNFEEAVAGVEDLGDVQDKSLSGQDVSQEFVDLEARLRNWEAQEAVLLRLMDRADTIGASIRVQNELQRVQLEIERIRGRLRFLEDQTALSTITASFVAAGVPPDSKPNVIERAVQQAVTLALNVMAALIVSLGILIPAAILVAAILFVFRQVRPRFMG